jgi:putative PIN family toxin of toxin-antitoxin system
VRIVLDTNVLVSGLLNPRGAPGRILDLVLAGDDVLIVDDRILDEYAEVLGRQEFGFDGKAVEALMTFFAATAEHTQAASTTSTLPDPDDQPFLEVANSSAADVLVTGNLRHFPKSAAGDVVVMNPAQYLPWRTKQKNP